MRRHPRALVIGRRRKGRGIRGIVREVGQTLSAAGWQVDGHTVARKRDLRRRAARAVKDGCDVVVAVGGDGAVGRVATALSGSRVALGIVPAGTGDLLAGNLGIPRSTAKAAAILLAGRVRRIDLGRVHVDGDERLFTVACGIGYDARVMDATGTGQKLRWGRLAYLANAVGQVGEIRNVAHEVTLDGAVTTTEAAQVFIANFGRMLPFVAPRRAIRPDDGALDVIVVTASGPLPGLIASWEAIRQTGFGESPGGHVLRARAREVRIRTDPSRLVELDGNVVGRTPVTVSVVPRALSVIVPRR